MNTSTALVESCIISSEAKISVIECANVNAVIVQISTLIFPTSNKSANTKRRWSKTK